MNTYGHKFLIDYGGSVSAGIELITPDSIIMYVQQGYNDGGIPPLSDIPSMIDELEARLKDSAEMAEMESKRNKLYKEVHAEGVSLGRNLSQLSATMDIIDAMTSGDVSFNDSNSDKKPYLLWALAFLGGFSDKFAIMLFSNLVGKYTSGKKEEEPEESEGEPDAESNPDAEEPAAGNEGEPTVPEEEAVQGEVGTEGK